MKNLNDLKLIERLDRFKMRDILANLPQQVREAQQLGKTIEMPPDSDRAKNIIFCGMGGSAIGAEVISCFLRDQLNVPIYINRDYTLPAFVGKESLVLLASYSGNTEETLSCYEEARKRQAKIMVISSGGRLIEQAKVDGYAHLLIPGGFPPRGALAFLSITVLPILAKLRLIDDKEQEVKEVISVLDGLRRDCLGIEIAAKDNPAKRLALSLADKICVVYASGAHLSAVVSRWRGQLAENSKALSSSHVLPEMNHNEIVGWRHPRKALRNFIAVFLRDKQDHPQLNKRIEISKEILQKEGVPVEEVYSSGEGLLARIFSLIYIGDYTSFYLAILNGEDPTAVARVDYLKKRLKEL